MSTTLVTRTEARFITCREVSEISGAPLAAVKKAVSQKVVRTRQELRGRKPIDVLDTRTAGAFTLLAETNVPLPIAAKRKVVNWAVTEPAIGTELQIDGLLTVKADGRLAEAQERASRYAQLRDELIVSDPLISGGEPVFRGTRVPVRGLARQIEMGETLEILREDYDFLPEEAFEFAPLWARANPKEGRPPRRAKTAPEQ